MKNYITYFSSDTIRQSLITTENILIAITLSNYASIPLCFFFNILNVLPKLYLLSLQCSSFSTITESTMSLNIITVTLNMGKTSHRDSLLFYC